MPEDRYGQPSITGKLELTELSSRSKTRWLGRVRTDMGMLEVLRMSIGDRRLVYSELSRLRAVSPSIASRSISLGFSSTALIVILSFSTQIVPWITELVWEYDLGHDQLTIADP